MRPAIFLDRDGTIIEERHYLCKPEGVRLLPGAAEALTALRHHGFACVVTSNQAGVGRGYFTQADLDLVHAEFLHQLTQAGAAIDGAYYCTEAPRTKDRTVIEHPDRKPAPGMLLRAARELDLELKRSWMIGDSISDVLAGRHAGCRSILVRSGNDVVVSLGHLRGEEVVVDDLAAAARWILANPR